jgi:DMSO/TMAO reductase YedYZ heme-binding membrane subunit
VNSHALWYLTRGTGISAMILVTASVLIGIAASMRAGGVRMPRFVVSGLHRNVSLLTVAFIVVHVVTTVLDAYAPISFLNAIIPFSSSYRTLWLGLGALAFDIILALVITSLVRVRIGLKTWRGIHWFAYACFPIVVVHALGTGSDASRRWMDLTTTVCVALVVIAILARLWQVRSEHGRLAVAGTLSVVAAPVLLGAWASNGPLAPDWASRAGTPSHLIGGKTRSTTSATTAAPLPAPPYSAPLTGSISQTPVDGSGNSTVTIDATSSGGTPIKIHVTLVGPSSSGQGLDALTTSSATYGPATDPTLYRGSVVNLSGNQVPLSLTTTATSPSDLLVTLNLQINLSAGTVSGQLDAR